MFYRYFRTPRCMYRRCYKPYWFNYPYWYYQQPYSVIGSSVQTAAQTVANTGIISGLNQAINQTSILS